MRVPLLSHLAPEVAVHVKGTTDSEYVYALLLTELGEARAGLTGDDVVAALGRALRTLQEIRASLGIDTRSSLNLFLAEDDLLVALR